MTLEFHALATLFPLLNGEDFDELVADIRANFLARCCAWCRKAETPSARVLPFGAGEHHAWLHAECWPAWHQSRRAEAVAALTTMGIASGVHDG